MTNRFDLQKAYLRKQEELLAKLNLPSGFFDHPTAKGDAVEANWCAMLQEFLPRRYGVGPIFAVDCHGQQSEQIDLAVYDCQYAPLFFSSPTGVLVVPAESIYAVFEVKPRIDKDYVYYAGKKAASVRALHRTSAEIRHAGGTYAPQDPDSKPILGGILAATSSWVDLEGKAATKALSNAPDGRHLDIGIALDALAFDRDVTSGDLSYSPADTQLIWFALHLFKKLQSLGTALAIALDDYERALY
ncbi:DUF6602 domain-containing protein [Rhodococcus rhodochrous]|uniref:DUF6602 domain-containing protein n=1 Tax=Rhodococcus rhodochrous TaxID=1829 RepID=UPI00177B685F|nr:DUF6602 domain-containing protein [Rhodococcus rhodochrous]QOH59408.1 hypothetical protein C6Y44_25135 [Rhodococcus rhodochrous]